MNKIDELINDNLNPYVAVRIITSYNEEELKQVELNLVEKHGLKLINSVSKKLISVDISPNESYLYTNKSNLDKFISLLDECNVEYQLNDAVDAIWEMDNLEQVLPMEDPCPEFTKEHFGNVENDRYKVLSILKLIFSRKFDINNVLEKISIGGMESLNELNKYFLK